MVLVGSPTHFILNLYFHCVENSVWKQRGNLLDDEVSKQK